MGQLKHVEALSALMAREVDLRRCLGVGRIVGEERPLRILMGLYVGPLNRRQAKSIAGAGDYTAGETLRLMLDLGIAEDAGRADNLHCYRLTPKGRRLLEAVVEAASESGEVVPPGGPVEPRGFRLIGERREAASAGA